MSFLESHSGLDSLPRSCSRELDQLHPHLVGLALERRRTSVPRRIEAISLTVSHRRCLDSETTRKTAFGRGKAWSPIKWGSSAINPVAPNPVFSIYGQFPELDFAGSVVSTWLDHRSTELVPADSLRTSNRGIDPP